MPKEARKELRITNDTANLSMVRSVVSDMINDSPLKPEDKNKVILAIDEAISNVIEHAYEDATGDIEVVLDMNATRLEVTVRDNGRKFNPDDVSDPDIHEHIRLSKKKGLGMYLMRKIMDEVAYNLESSFQNELVMRKFMGGAAGSGQKASAG